MKYPIVHVRFLDHSMTTGEDIRVIPCEVIGYLVKEDSNSIAIASWVCDGIIDSQDTELFVIVKHKGLKIRKLK